MVLIFYIGLFLFFSWMILSTGFQLIGIALGTEGLGGIIAFWIGMGLLYIVGSVIGAW